MGLLGAALVLASVGTAMSGALDIVGTHGNQTGCTVAGGGDYLSDDKLILTPAGIESHETYCEFVQVLRSSIGAFVTTTLCQSEGMSEIRMFTISQADPENDSRLIFFADGGLFGEVAPCS